MQLKSFTPILFLTCTDFCVKLVHNLHKFFLCSTKCDIKTDFSIARLSLLLINCSLTFKNVRVVL